MSLFYQAHIGQDNIGGKPLYVVIIRNRLLNRIVTIGVFYAKHSAEHWAMDTIKRRAWRDASELPDDHDKGHTS